MKPEEDEQCNLLIKHERLIGVAALGLVENSGR